MSFQRPISFLTARERRGFNALLFIVILLVGIYFIMPLIASDPEFEYGDFEAEIVKYQNSLKSISAPVNEKEIMPFDVNAVTFSSLLEYGIEEDIAARWIKFREAIGGYDSIEQVGKIYGINRQWYERNQDKLKITKRPQEKVVVESSRESRIFNFDPNEITREEMELLGFREETILALEQFREKEGYFGSKEDLKSLDGLSESFYEKISNYILIEKREVHPNKSRSEADTVLTASFEKPAIREEITSIDINRSNQYQWQLLKGIGPAYARWIVNYRDKLGGFSSIDQVGETFNLPDTVFRAIRPFLSESEIIRPLRINQLPADSLRMHPYINWKQASILENYRTQHGPYQSAEDLYKIRVFDTVFVSRLSPYLSFN